MAASSIPIQNIYFLLAYAWEHFRGSDEFDVDESHCPDVHNLLAMLLSNGISRLATSGMDKSYLPIIETTPRLRGRIDVLASHRRMTHVSGRMICEFDELTANTLPNQILKATCRRLISSTSQLTKDNRKKIRHALHLLSDIDDIQINSKTFYRVQLHRNNRHYRLLVNVCRLLHDLFLPDEEAGHRRFRSILEDETKMSQLFEKFILHFARKHIRATKIWPMQMKWDGEWPEETGVFVPKMITDVTIDRPAGKTILDCKFYKEALSLSFDQYRLRPSHLYQLTAYLRNKSVDASWEDVRGILLYPTVRHPIDVKLKLQGHNVEIRSIDLAQDWRKIHDDLLAILL